MNPQATTYPQDNREGRNYLAGIVARPGPYLLLVQGLYYAATGLWALVSIETFQKVTGPKADIWLVKTVGVLVTVIGGVLLLAGLRRRATAEVALLGVGSAAGLAAIDVVYVARGRISPIYLADALAEVALVAGWAFVWLQRSGSHCRDLGWLRGARGR